MSILLDSLRKSEAQRNFGETPSIHGTQHPGSMASAPKQWIAVLMIILAAAVVTWFGWRQYSAAEVAPSASRAPEVELAAAEEGETAPPEAGPIPSSGTGGAESGTPVERLSQVPGPEISEAEISGDEIDPSAADRIARFAAEDEDSMSGEPEAIAPEIDPGLEEAVAEESVEESDPADDYAAVAAAAPARRARVESSDSEPLTYWQLPQSLRGDMPEFKITVLVYADAPEDRFILINGERLKEQEELESGVVLQEIRRDGAVFSYRSYRFLVKS